MHGSASDALAALQEEEEEDRTQKPRLQSPNALDLLVL